MSKYVGMIRLKKDFVDNVIDSTNNMIRAIRYQSVNMTKYGDSDICRELDEIVLIYNKAKKRLESLHVDLIEDGYYKTS